jgi:serine protease Do
MLYDKTEYIASIVGSDSSSDIAVLKIGASGLTPAQFADSDTCELGDEVVTVGSPAGLENSVTKGIISGLDRQIHSESSSTSMNCIQIDAAINPGNSGGPLFNMWGQVIGINSSKLVSSSYDNIGFAITVNAAKPIIEELMEKGYVADKARIGITYYAISEEKAELMNVEPGLCVVSIDEDCNIAETEIQQGDIIMELNGTPTSDNDAVSEVMNGLEPGDKMTCKVYRPSTEENASVEDGEYFEITFKLNSDKNSFVQTDE